MAILSAEGLRTGTVVISVGVGASSIVDARSISGALVHVSLTNVPLESGVGAVASIGVQAVQALSAVLTWVRGTLVDFLGAQVPGVSRRAMTLVVLKAQKKKKKLHAST